jgi:hypothetical protein
MDSSTKSQAVDLNLVDQMYDLIPEWTWNLVKDHLVNLLVDIMPTTILERLTGDPTGDERALEILDDYYKSSDMNKELLIDSFKILGSEQTAYALDSLQLNKISNPNSND